MNEEFELWDYYQMTYFEMDCASWAHTLMDSFELQLFHIIHYYDGPFSANIHTKSICHFGEEWQQQKIFSNFQTLLEISNIKRILIFLLRLGILWGIILITWKVTLNYSNYKMFILSIFHAKIHEKSFCCFRFNVNFTTIIPIKYLSTNYRWALLIMILSL